MVNTLKAQITTKEYVEKQILKYLNEAVGYRAEVEVATKRLEGADTEMNKKLITAITAIKAQLEAGEVAIKIWTEYYELLPDENCDIIK